MGRFRQVVGQAVAAVRTGVADWNQFWFTPTEATTLGLIRILSGCLLFYTHFVWSLDFPAFFDDDGWQDPELVREVLAGTSARSFWWYVPPAWRFTAHILALIILGLYTVGLRTRETSLLALAIVVSYAHRLPLATFGVDQICTLLTAYLAVAYSMLSPRDARLTLDRWCYLALAGRHLCSNDLPARPHAAVTVAQRLIQVHLCLVYLFSGISKLKGETWWDGTAVWLAAANLEYQTFDLTRLAWHPGIVNVLTVATVTFETMFAIFIWKPGWRPWLMGFGLLLHFGIGLCLGLWTFSLAMMICYLAFLPSRGGQVPTISLDVPAT